MSKSKTVRESCGYSGKIKIRHAGGFIWIDSDGEHRINLVALSTKRARELFEAGLQMCDELEGK